MMNLFKSGDMQRAAIGAFGIGAFAAGISTYAVLKTFGISVHIVEGPSMRPTFNPSGSFLPDIVLVKQEDQTNIPNIPKSSVICIKHPKRDKGYLIKRLTAHQNEPMDRNIKIPENHCLVTSDAGAGYLDSTSYLGPIPYSQVVGKVSYIILPPNRAKKL